MRDQEVGPNVGIRFKISLLCQFNCYSFFADKYYNDNMEEEGPSVTSIVIDLVTKMTDIMRDNVTTKTILDVESKVRSDLSFINLLIN